MASSDQAPSSISRSSDTGATVTRQIKTWVRAAASCPPDAVVMVSELACSEPGCPPTEVVMAILEAGLSPRQRKLHGRLTEVTEAAVRDLWTHEKSDDNHHQHSEE